MKSRFFLAVAFSCVLLASGCSSSGNRLETGGTERTGIHLDEAGSMLIMTPKDGSSGGKIYAGSGTLVAQRTDASFSRYARLVDVYPSEYHSVEALKDVIAKNGYDYIVVPTLVVWGHKDKDWSKTANQVGVKISVIDAASGKEISSNFLEGKEASSWGIYGLISPSSSAPEDLFSDMVDDYVDNLYGAIIAFPSR